MKKTIIIFIFGIVIGLAFIGSNLLINHKIVNDKKDVTLPNVSSTFEANVYGYLYFYNLDSNHDALLNGFRYELSTWNKKISFPSYEDDDYYFTDENENLNFNEAYDLLSDTQKETIDNVKTYGDFYDTWIKDFNTKGEEVYQCFVGFDNNNIVFCQASMPTYYVLEQTIVPSGYTKQKYIIPGFISLYYYYETDDDLSSGDSITNINRNQELTLDYMEFFNIDSARYLFNYDNYDNLLLKDRYDSIDYDDDIYEEINANEDIDCLEYPDNRIDEDFINNRQGRGNHLKRFNSPFVSYNGYCSVSIINRRGAPSLTINSLVNEKENITITSSTVLEYNVKVNNNGNSVSYDNVIVSKLPIEFTYVEGSASNGGVYDPNNHSITWNLMRLDSNRSINLRYRASAPGDLVSLKNYETVATIESSSVNGRIVSNKANVKLLSNIISNPKTNAPIIGIAITLIIVWGVAIYLCIDRKRKLIKQ